MEIPKSNKMYSCISPIILSIILSLFTLKCDSPNENDPPKEVPHEERWGIYVLDLASENVELITSSSSPFSFFHLSSTGEYFIFSRKINGTTD